MLTNLTGILAEIFVIDLFFSGWLLYFADRVTLFRVSAGATEE
jgi:hypothetical protein